jgi:CBS domain-containing protein
MKIRDILDAKNSGIVSIEPNRTVKEAMNKIVEYKIGALPVMDGDALQGIITERDIFNVVHNHGEEGLRESVKKAMTSDIIIGLPDDDIDEVSSLLTQNRFRHLPIMENKKLIGIISIGDLVKAHSNNLTVENRHLKDYISGDYPK